MSDYLCFFSGHFFCITVHRCTAMHDHKGVMYTHQSNILQDIAKRRKTKDEGSTGQGLNVTFVSNKATTFVNQAYSEYRHSLTFRVRLYVVIATKPVHRLQIRPIVHNYDPLPFPSLHPGPCSSVGMQRGTDRRTDGRDQCTFRLGYASREM